MKKVSNLALERKMAGMSQSELGEKIGVRRDIIAKYEHGSTSLTVKRLYQLSDALGVPAVALLTDPDDYPFTLIDKLESLIRTDSENKKYKPILRAIRLLGQLTPQQFETILTLMEIIAKPNDTSNTIDFILRTEDEE